MTTIYLIRHAEAEGNLYRIAQGWNGSILTEWGLLQLNQLRERFRDVPIDNVYASILYRSYTTAYAISGPKNLIIKRREDLREIGIGEWEGKSWGAIARESPEELENFNKHPEQWHVTGAESVQELQDRMWNVMQEIIQENPNRAVAVVSHGYAIRVFLAKLEGIPLSELEKSPVGPNTSVSLIEAENDKMQLIYRDNAEHLKAMPPAPQRASALEPGLYYLPATAEDQAFIDSCGEPIREDLPLLVAWQDEKPVGLLQLDTDREQDQQIGWVSLYWIAPKYRRRGLGTQMLGKVVFPYRRMERLRIRTYARTLGALRFLRYNGFIRKGNSVYEKYVGPHQVLDRKNLDFIYRSH